MNTKRKLMASIFATTVLLSACDDDDNRMAMMEMEAPEPTPVIYRYSVTVTNLTHAQPLSPLAVVLHNEGMLWQVGMAASSAVEMMAESGDNSELLALDIALASESGEGMLMPGMSETVEISITDTMANFISVASMLVNTNDAFTGLNAYNIANLAAGESISMVSGSYDAGTENNSESAQSIPGPAGGGEGFNEMRDDVDYVAMHPGVVSKEDGLSSSVLTFDHRFDNPTAKVVVARIE